MAGQAATGTFTAGLVQMRTSRNVDHSVGEASRLIREAAKGGAEYVQTPEMTNIMELNRERLFTWVKPEEGNPSLAHFRALARELGLWLHIGSLAIKLSEETLANRAFLISPEGVVAARYDKIHMFDVNLPNGESYRESKRYVSGKETVVAALPWGGLGVTICYDMRFPQLYRALAKGGADFLTMPSAFTKQTGEAHWHILLRARAIETGCYVLAAAQGGMHENGRATYGHSLVVDPWGQVIAELAHDEPGVLLAKIEVAKVADVRARIPSLEHDRPFGVAAAGKRSLAPASATDKDQRTA
jgi:predicted amidohydrolase